MKKIERQKLLSKDISGKEWIGKVVDNNDPEKMGRCKVEVFGLFDGLDKGKLPWAFPASNNMFAGGKGGFGQISVPKKDTLVKVRFNNGDIYAPEYFGIQNINEAVKADIKDSYLNSHVLAYDEDEELKVFYTPNKGMTIFLKNSKIVINPDKSITIEHADSQSIIELVGPNINITANSTINLTSNSLIKAESSEVNMNGSSVTKLGPAPVYSAVGSEPLWMFLKILAAAVDAKLPSTPGVMTAQAQSFEQLSTSKNVKLSL